MHVLYDYNLTSETGFKTPIQVRKYVLIEHIDDLSYLPNIQLHAPLIIGGATNYLFVNPEIDEAIHYVGSDLTCIEDSEEYSIIRVEAGKQWHAFVMEMLDAKLYGLENLVLIPGTCGAAPVQNIGAYGSEVSESILAVHCYDLQKAMMFTLTNDECMFGYRHSIFKTLDWKHILITHVDFRLNKQASPIAKYPDVDAYFTEQGIEMPNAHDIANAIIDIRMKKLPDPNYIGNAGSFFKNPVIDISHFSKLQLTYPDMPSYSVNEQMVKIPAGWLIDKAGWKGSRHNGAGVHDRQALVLINAENAEGQDILALAKKIQESIYDTYHIMLEPEVNIIL